MINSIAKNLLKWWHRKFGLYSGSRNSNLFKLCAAFNDYGIDRDYALALISEFQQEDFNSQMQPGILGFLGLGASALGAGADVVGALKRNDFMKQSMAGMPGSNLYGPPSYMRSY